MSINKENVKDIKLVDKIIDGSQNIQYNNLASGLSATTVKDAIDEIGSPTGVIADSYGSSTEIPVLSIDDKGRIISASTADINNYASVDDATALAIALG